MVPHGERLSLSVRTVRAVLGGTVAAAASFLSTSIVIHQELGGFGAISGLLIGSIGGAFATVKTWQVIIPAALWGTFAGPVAGLTLLYAILQIGGVGM